MTCIAIAYPDPDILTQQAVGMAFAVLNKMADDTDNHKKLENAKNKTALCSTVYTKANIRRISLLSSRLKAIRDSKSAVTKTFQKGL